MDERQSVYRDPLSRVAVRQIAWLGAAATLGFIALMAALAWGSSLTSSGIATFGAIDFDANAISISIRQEPPQLDHTRMSDVVSGMLATHIFEGLLRYDAKGDLAPGVAERWNVRSDGAVFWLRGDALWSDGKPVTARDFVFSWRRVVDPATASQYAFIFYVIKNGEAINNGKLPPSTLGVRAIDDRTLEVDFENPVAYFEKLVAFPTYLPMREDFYASRNGRYAADADDLLFNGPFQMTQWIHGSAIRLEKNQTYWNRDAVKLNIIDIPYITSDPNALLNLYRDRQIVDVLALPSESLKQALEERWPLGRFSDGSVWFLQLNHRPGRLTSNFHFRKALQLVTDNNELVNKVLKVPSYTVADSLFPSWLTGERGLFKQEYPPPTVTPDPIAAREHLETARQELRLDRFPPMVILVDDTTTGVKNAEYLQNLFARTLGIEVRIDKQIFRQRLAKAEAGDFDIVIYGWGPDFDDPLTFGDLFASWNLNNHAKYNNPELDAQVRIAQRSLNQAERMAAFGMIQRILIEDVVIIPNYERGQMFVQDPRLKGVVHRAIGAESDYTGAYLVADP
jgi:oligopeptide transport system substrate-binding protein